MSLDITYLIEKYPDKRWNWYELSANPNITMSYIINNPDKPWDWCCLSLNPNMTMSDVLNNPDKPWYWPHLSVNKNITMSDVINNPNKPWSLSHLSKNPNITISFIEQNMDKIDFQNLSINTFTDNTELFKILDLLNIPYDITLIIVEYFTKKRNP